jgi:hypothetical protein
MNQDNGIYRAKYSKANGKILNVDVTVIESKGIITITILNQIN